MFTNERCVTRNHISCGCGEEETVRGFRSGTLKQALISGVAIRREGRIRIGEKNIPAEGRGVCFR